MSTDIVRAAPTPQGLDASVRFAQLLADADLLPKQFVGKPANVLYAIEYGRTLGIAPVAAITGIHVIEGKPSASSGLIGGLVRQAGHKLRVTSDGATTATAQIIRSDDPDFVYEATWTLERAVIARLCEIKDGKPWARDRNGKPTAWEKYPAAMLKARAITEVARDACEDVLFGLHYTPEELGAIVNQDGEPIEASVTQLRRVEPGEPDQWATPAPAPQEFVPHAGGQQFADGASQDAKGKDHINAVWTKAAAANVLAAKILAPDTKQPDDLGAYLKRLGATLPDVAPAAAGQDDGVTDAEFTDPVAEAEQQLRATAARVGLDTLDADFQQSYGLPITEAGVQQINEMNQLLTGSAGAA
jgi:hypothetical protein